MVLKKHLLLLKTIFPHISHRYCNELADETMTLYQKDHFIYKNLVDWIKRCKNQRSWHDPTSCAIWLEYFDTMQLINDFCQSWYVTVTNWWCSVVFMFCYNWEQAKMIWQINGVKSILLDCMNYFPSPKFYSLVNTFRSKNTKCTRCKSYLYFSQWLSNLLCN